ARRLIFHELWGNFSEPDRGQRPDHDVHKFLLFNKLRQMDRAIWLDSGPEIGFVRGNRGAESRRTRRRLSGGSGGMPRLPGDIEDPGPGHPPGHGRVRRDVANFANFAATSADPTATSG